MKLLGKKIYRIGSKPYKNGYGSIGNRGKGAESYSSSNCCVHPETQISMADGTTKNAKDILIGDKLQTQAGIGTVEIITTPVLGQRYLYSYGRGSYFITGDHPIHANGEWKSLTPKYSKLNYDVDCKPLKRGDELTLINGDKVRLERLEGRADNPDLVLYDFHMDGNEDANHTYFANGLLVHNGGSGGGGGGGGGCGYDKAYGESAGNTWSSDQGVANTGSPQDLGGSNTAVQSLSSQTDAQLAASQKAFDKKAAAEAEAKAQKTADQIAGDQFDAAQRAKKEEYSAELDGGDAGDTSFEDLGQKQKEVNDWDDGTPAYQTADDMQPDNYDSFQEEIALAEQTDTLEDQGQFSGMVDPSAYKDEEGFDGVPGIAADVGGLQGAGASGLHPSQVQAGVQSTEDIIRQNAEDASLEQKPGDLNAARDFKDEYEEAGVQYDQGVLADKLEKQENLENIDSHKDYNKQLQDMWDEGDKSDLTANELQQLKDSNYIKGDVNQVSGDGAAGDTTNLTDAQPVDSTPGKIEQGQQLSQVDYQNWANLPEDQRVQAYNEMNPDATLEGAVEFANLTGTSVIPLLSQQNIANLAHDVEGYNSLSMTDKAALVHDQGLELTSDAVKNLPQKDWDDYYNMKYQPTGVPIPDPNEDPEGYRNYNNMKNRVYVGYIENSPEYRGKRVEWAAKNLAAKGFNYGKKKLRQFANMKIQGMLSVAAQTALMGMIPGGVVPPMITSALYNEIMKKPKSLLARELNKGYNAAGLTPTEAVSMGDAFDNFDGSPEGQAAFDNVSQNPEFQSQVDNNWQNMNGMVNDPNNMNMEAGIGAMTAIYGYNRDGIPMTREEAQAAGVNVTQKEQEYKDSGTSINQQGVGGTPIDDAGQSFSGDEEVFGPQKEQTQEEIDLWNEHMVQKGGGLSPGDTADITLPGSTTEGGDDVPDTTSGGAPNERWERFMEMMEKRASGEADSLSEKAMKREREEGLKERMAMMAMGRGQPSAAGLRQYDRAKGAADRELAGDAAVARQQEMQIAQGQFGDALTSQLDRESRERTSKYSTDMTKTIKGMDVEEAKRSGNANMWFDAAKMGWTAFGGDITKWIKDGWTEKSAKEAIEHNGGTVSSTSQHPVDGGNKPGSGSYSPPAASIYDHSGNNYPTTTNEQDDKGYYYYDKDQRTWIWDEYPYAEGGKVEGPGTETSDDIPALLSDGEFVIKASAVKGLGRSKGAKDDKEARDKGIELLYELQSKYGDLEEYSHGGAAFGDVLAERRLLDRNRVRG